jgi:outer membrane protein TolC
MWLWGTTTSNVVWPVFDGGRTRANLQQNDTSLQNNQLAFVNEQLAIREEVAESWLDLLEAVVTADSAIAQVSEARIALSQARADASRGEISQINVLDAERDVNTATFNLLDTILEYNRALTRLQWAIGDFSLAKEL